MTLILGAITKDCAVLVSDRRLTNGLTGARITDDENKTVCLHGSLLMGYTGLARLDNRNTHMWIANTVAGHNTPQAFQALADAATLAIKPYKPKYRHLAFLSVGWATRTTATDFHHSNLIPCAFILSNFILPDGQHLPKAQPTFCFQKMTLGNQRSAVFAVGCQVEAETLATLKRTIGRYAQANPGNPTGIADILAKSVLDVALKNKAVGNRLMIASLPRAAVPADQLSIGNRWKSDMTTLYYEPDGRTIQYGPTVVDRSGFIFSDMVARFGN